MTYRSYNFLSGAKEQKERIAMEGQEQRTREQWSEAFGEVERRIHWGCPLFLTVPDKLMDQERRQKNP